MILYFSLIIKRFIKSLSEVGLRLSQNQCILYSSHYGISLKPRRLHNFSSLLRVSHWSYDSQCEEITCGLKTGAFSTRRNYILFIIKSFNLLWTLKRLMLLLDKTGRCRRKQKPGCFLLLLKQKCNFCHYFHFKYYVSCVVILVWKRKS